MLSFFRQFHPDCAQSKERRGKGETENEDKHILRRGVAAISIENQNHGDNRRNQADNEECKTCAKIGILAFLWRTDCLGIQRHFERDDSRYKKHNCSQQPKGKEKNGGCGRVFSCAICRGQPKKIVNANLVVNQYYFRHKRRQTK